MTTMQEGKRKCDERCYNAKRLGCDCICGGVNHGLGREHAELIAEFVNKGYTPEQAQAAIDADVDPRSVESVNANTENEE